MIINLSVNSFIIFKIKKYVLLLKFLNLLDKKY